jgi:hypothetical protein
MPLDDDLYRSLVDESKTYREKVSTIWLQKFTMLGAIIAFAATQRESAGQDHLLIGAAILSLPLIAILLDVKLGEFGVHARIVDDFIIANFPEPPILGKWERAKWGISDEPGPDRSLVRYRSIATVAVTVIPTCLIAVLSVLAARPYLGDRAMSWLLIAAIAFCPIYAVMAVISGPAVLFRPAPPSSGNKGRPSPPAH